MCKYVDYLLLFLICLLKVGEYHLDELISNYFVIKT